jgi:hypothetical protein
MGQRYFEEQLRKSTSLDSFSLIMTRAKKVDASFLKMGGKSGLVEENHNSVQQPLPSEDKTTKWVDPKTQYPEVRIMDKICCDKQECPLQNSRS